MNDYMKQRMGKILAGRPLPEKKKYTIPKVSEKRQKKLDELKANGDSEMDIFFASQRKHMKGKCLFCSAKTMKGDDEKFHYSIAHLLAKNKNAFPSVATHPDNWIELCFWGNNCHHGFDTGKITWEFIADSKEFEIIKEKLLNILPAVAESERKNKLYDRLVKLVY